MYNDLLDSDQFHNDDLFDVGPALNAVRFIGVDREAVAKRNLALLHERIRREKTYQEKNGDLTGVV